MNLTLKDMLKSKLSKKEVDYVRTSYDVIGDIALIEIPTELKKKEKIIAQALMRRHKNIRTVAKKLGIREGEFRILRIKVIQGNPKTETLYKESSAKMILDVAKVYFSPRLASERLRIARLVKNKEVILVMFSGCAPYPFVIAKNSPAKIVYGIEKNPVAHKYAVQNVKLNKLEKKIVLIKGDVKNIVKHLDQKFDRIVMPLPKSSESFLKEALSVAKRPCYIHYYAFSTLDESRQLALNIKDAIKILGRNCEIINIVKCGQYSPRVYRICIDFLLK